MIARRFIQGVSLALCVLAQAAGDAISAENFAGKDLAGKDLTSQRLEDADFSGAKLKGAIFRRAILRGANFSEAQLAGADFRYADVRGANFRMAQGLNAKEFRNAIYSESTQWPEGFQTASTGARLVEDIRKEPASEPAPPSVIKNGTDEEALEKPKSSAPAETEGASVNTPVASEAGPAAPKKGAELPQSSRINHEGKDLTDKTFTGYMAQAVLDATKLTRTNFSNCDLRGASFVAAEIEDTNFDGADLSYAKFGGATLVRPSFKNAKLIGADLHGQVLHLNGWEGYFEPKQKLDVDYRTAQTLTMIDAERLDNGDLNFKGANLQKTVIYGNLEGVNFRNADLRGANLGHATKADPRLFKGAIYDSRTIWGDIEVSQTTAIRGEDLVYEEEVKQP